MKQTDYQHKAIMPLTALFLKEGVQGGLPVHQQSYPDLLEVGYRITLESKFWGGNRKSSCLEAIAKTLRARYQGDMCDLHFTPAQGRDELIVSAKLVNALHGSFGNVTAKVDATKFTPRGEDGPVIDVTLRGSCSREALKEIAFHKKPDWIEANKVFQNSLPEKRTSNQTNKLIPLDTIPPEDQQVFHAAIQKVLNLFAAEADAVSLIVDDCLYEYDVPHVIRPFIKRMEFAKDFFLNEFPEAPQAKVQLLTSVAAIVEACAQATTGKASRKSLQPWEHKIHPKMKAEEFENEFNLVVPLDFTGYKTWSEKNVTPTVVFSNPDPKNKIPNEISVQLYSGELPDLGPCELLRVEARLYSQKGNLKQSLKSLLDHRLEAIEPFMPTTEDFKMVPLFAMPLHDVVTGTLQTNELSSTQILQFLKGLPVRTQRDLSHLNFLVEKRVA